MLGETDNQEVSLTNLTLCEVLQGIRSDKLFLETQEELATFPLFSLDGEELAIASAQNYRTLRTRGITIRKTIDCLIATFCIAQGHTLLHNDRDFDPFEDHLGLQVLHPQTS